MNKNLFDAYIFALIVKPGRNNYSPRFWVKRDSEHLKQLNNLDVNCNHNVRPPSGHFNCWQPTCRSLQTIPIKLGVLIQGPVGVVVVEYADQTLTFLKNETREVGGVWKKSAQPIIEAEKYQSENKC